MKRKRSLQFIDCKNRILMNKYREAQQSDTLNRNKKKTRLKKLEKKKAQKKFSAFHCLQQFSFAN